MIQRGWLLAENGGQREEGLAQMQEGLAKHREIGAVVLVPAFLAMVAELHQKLGRPAEGLAAVTEALTVAQQSGQHYWESELHRLTGVLTLEAAPRPGRGAAERRRVTSPAGHRDRAPPAGEVAGAARDDEPDATVGRPGEASRRRARSLSGVYAWFTEGLDIVRSSRGEVAAR